MYFSPLFRRFVRPVFMLHSTGPAPSLGLSLAWATVQVFPQVLLVLFHEVERSFGVARAVHLTTTVLFLSFHVNDK